MYSTVRCLTKANCIIVNVIITVVVIILRLYHMHQSDKWHCINIHELLGPAHCDVNTLSGSLLIVSERTLGPTIQSGELSCGAEHLTVN